MTKSDWCRVKLNDLNEDQLAYIHDMKSENDYIEIYEDHELDRYCITFYDKVMKQPLMVRPLEVKSVEDLRLLIRNKIQGRPTGEGVKLVGAVK